MTLSLNFAELNSLASLSAIAHGPASDTPVLSHVHVKIAGQRLTAHATDRYVAARIEFDMTHERDSEGLLEFTVSAETLKKALASGKRAGVAMRHHGASLAHLTLGEGSVEIVIGNADTYRSHPPRLPGAMSDSNYPPIWRLFPEGDEHVNEIAAGQPIDVEALAKLAKLRHPDDALTGRAKTNVGAFRLSLAKPATDEQKSPPWYFTRRGFQVAAIVQPINGKEAEIKDRGSL